MKRRSGFTLIEMMIVLAIIAALSATLVPIAMNALNQAKVTGNLTDVGSIRLAEMQYFAKERSLTDSLSADKNGLGIYLNFDNLQSDNLSGDYDLNALTNYLEVKVPFENEGLAKAFLAQWTDVVDGNIPKLSEETAANLNVAVPTDEDDTGYQQYADFSNVSGEEDTVIYIYYGFK